ncbi:sialate O-acetylesterase, partial [Flavobacterium sp.]|uniref:sialate O-acetylesterase n=1 Tax=Flavobacterium sp. TaxID=239 RepID=UPI003C48106D
LHAQTELASVFGDHMVLQRNTKAAVWGTDKPYTKITIQSSWGEQSTTTTDKDGNWVTSIKTTKEGGPYVLTVNGSQKIEVKDILLGEVWLCSGQSNMARQLKGAKDQPVEGSEAEIANSKNPNLRFFTVKLEMSLSPLTRCKGTWEISEPKTAANFSATAYFFGKKLQQELGVPVGLISSNQGSTPAEAWSPNTVASRFPRLEKILKEQPTITIKTPTVLYNAMINPLIPFTIKGAIWYQGEANRNYATEYTTLFPAMIQSWRDNWKQGDFPFYFVQLAPLGFGGDNWVALQHSQLKVFLNTPNTGMVVTNDIGDEKCIHPPKKKEVGDRLALWALAKNYGFDKLEYSGPVYKSMMINKNQAILNFDYATNGLSSNGKKLTDFEMAGKDGVYYPAMATIIKGNQLQITSDKVVEPVVVRYAWKSFLEGSLFNTAGLPASAFITDPNFVFDSTSVSPRKKE